MRHAIRLSFPLVAVAAAAAAALAQDAEKAPLAAKFVKGASAEIVQTATSAQSFSSPNGMGQQQETTMDRVWTETVESVGEDGSATVQVKFGRIKGSATSMMGVLSFDSDAPAAASDGSDPMAAMTGQFAKAFTALAGKTATVTFAKDGTPGEVKGIDRAADEAAGQGPGAGAARQMARAFASPDAVKNWMRLAHPKLPEKSVGVGDTWTEVWPQDFAAGRKLTVTMTYKVTALDAESVTVAADGKFELDAPTAAEGGKGGTGGDGAGGAGGAGGASGAGGAGGAPGAPGGPGAGGGRGGAGGRGGMSRMLEDAKLDKSSMTGTGKVSRKDGMILVADSAMSLSISSASSGVSMEQSSKSHIERKKPAATPAAPPAPPAPAPAPPAPK